MRHTMRRPIMPVLPSLLALAVATAPVARAQPAAATLGPALDITVSQGTHLAFALSPDRSRVVIDLQGVLFVLPAGGGKAVAMTDALFDARQPTWSPDGRTIAFQSNRDGQWRIWLVDADGGHPRRLSADAYEEREPCWSADGRAIAYTSNRDGKFDVWRRDVASGAVTRVSQGPGGNSRGTFSPDGRSLAYVSDRPGATGIYVVGPDGTERQVAHADVVAFGMTVPMGTPSWTPDGAHVLYARIADGHATLMQEDTALISGEDVQPFRAQWLDDHTLLYSSDGQLKRRDMITGAVVVVPFSATLTLHSPVYAKKHQDFDSPGPRPAIGVQRAVLAPDGQSVAFAALGALWRMDLAGGAPRQVVDGGVHEVIDPAFSPDGRMLAYADDRNGSFDIWTIDLATGTRQRRTSAPGAELRPAWSADGRLLTYVDASGAYLETVHVLDLATGSDRVVKAAGDSPGYPSFAGRGHDLVVSSLRNASASQSYVVGGINQAALVSDRTGEARVITLVPGHSVGNRSGDGPLLSPDGTTWAFQMDSALWVMPAAPDGSPAAAPRRLSDMIPTGLSWAGDSRHLLAYAGARMALFDVTDGSTRAVPLTVSWQAAQGTGSVVIHAGALVDGIHPEARRDVDILVEGARIRAIVPHGSRTWHAPVIEAPSLTAMPGLMDMHAHLIKEFGSRFGRLWLAYGITAIRSPGNVPGDVLEEKEAIAAGRRPGPHMFVTGYILDGQNTVWEMGASVASADEAQRQVALAADLGYDMIKSYVHTAEPIRAAIVAAAHAHGLPVSSHDIYPAALFGSDSAEHLDGNGAGRGYSAKASQLYISYDDAIQIIARSGMTITPTVSLFTPAADLVDPDPSIAAARWALQPSWVRATPIMTFASGPGGPILLAHIRDDIRRLHAAGARIVVGTDSPFTPIGINTHNELLQEVKAGLTPFEALRSATVVPAALMGVSADLGTIEPGKIADIVLVDGNPLQDIRAAGRVRKVMTMGRMVDLSDLLQK